MSLWCHQDYFCQTLESASRRYYTTVFTGSVLAKCSFWVWCICTEHIVLNIVLNCLVYFISLLYVVLEFIECCTGWVVITSAVPWSSYDPDTIVVYEVRSFTACSENNLPLRSCLINTLYYQHRERSDGQKEKIEKRSREGETNCIMFSHNVFQLSSEAAAAN